MRPVDRGQIPKAAGGGAKVVRDYGEYREDLVQCLGCYCSYCEAPVSAKIEVEHIAPKGSNPNLRVAWDNLLLACGFCNPEKGRYIDRTKTHDHLWPDRDNTARAFKYGEGGTVHPAAGLGEETERRAFLTRGMIGLNGPHQLAPTDARKRRWNLRREAWDRIVDARGDLQDNDTPAMRRQIVAHARSLGFWSMWMAVFADDPAMRRELAGLIPGTANDCFDADARPCLARPGGVL